MNREPYRKEKFPFDKIPQWKCPICHQGNLFIVNESFFNKETPGSIKDKEIDGWEPDWTRSIFSCLLECNNSDCGELVSCCGTGDVEFTEYEDENGELVQLAPAMLNPSYFEPPLVIIDIPEKCPPSVAAHLQESFGLFFADPGAALNAARTSIEALVTSLKVRRFDLVENKKTKKKERKLIMLHGRIQMLPAKYHDIKDRLEAAKWLGNAGSHSGSIVRRNDLITAYDLLENVLSEIYEQKDKKIKSLAGKINKNKGPLKPVVKKKKKSIGSTKTP